MTTKKDLVAGLERMKIGPGIKGSTFYDTEHDSISARYGYNEAIKDVIAFIEKANIDTNPGAEADVNLIAAAPDLLAACQKSVYAQIKETIKKATK